MINTLVSIIMPAYNAEKFIPESIESVLAQSYTNWELVIIDDGSTDNTAEICKEYETSDKRIRYYYQENSKQGKARNLGVSKSNGSILAFLDADDLWLPAKLEKSMQIFEEGDHDLVFTDAYVFTHSGEIANNSSLHKLGITSNIYKGDDGLAAFLYKNKIPMLTVLVKKDAVLAAGGFSIRGVAEDYELWLKLLAAGYVFKSTDACLSLYRVHEHATTSTDKLAVEHVAEMLSDFFRDKPALRSRFRKQIKTWLRRYLELHLNREKNTLELPAVFNGFNTYVYQYKLLSASKKVLPARVFTILHRML